MTVNEKEKLKLTIRQWRSLKGMSKAKLSRDSGVTERTIYRLEETQKMFRTLISKLYTN